MTQLYANNARSTLAANITTLSTSITVATGHGVKFPSPTGSDYFLATLVSGIVNEIVKCTSRTGDVLTVVRGQEGTTPAGWGIGATIEMRVTRDTLTNHETVVNNVRVGQIPFPATQNPSADPNTLDDYEEGVWTPVLLGNFGHSPAAYFTQKGRYTKIGNYVSFSGEIQINGYGTLVNSEAVFVTGLPFTPGSGPTYPGRIPAFLIPTPGVANFLTTPVFPHARMDAVDPVIYLRADTVTDLLKDDLRTNSNFYFSGSFWV